MTVKEQVVHALTDLSEVEVAQVAEYLDFLRFRREKPPSDEGRLAALYAEFADEDRGLAEQGMAEYAEQLSREDTA